MGKGKRTLRGGTRLEGLSALRSSLFTGSLGRVGSDDVIRGGVGSPPRGNLGSPPKEGIGGGVIPGNGFRSDNFGSPGMPMGGLVPGGM